jgi:hypothetical protein
MVSQRVNSYAVRQAKVAIFVGRACSGKDILFFKAGQIWVDLD